jgi:hypothetical protein
MEGRASLRRVMGMVAQQRRAAAAAAKGVSLSPVAKVGTAAMAARR